LTFEHYPVGHDWAGYTAIKIMSVISGGFGKEVSLS